MGGLLLQLGRSLLDDLGSRATVSNCGERRDNSLSGVSFASAHSARKSRYDNRLSGQKLISIGGILVTILKYYRNV